MSIYFSDKFKKGCQNIGLDLKEIDSGLWYYIGGNSDRHYRYFKLKFPSKPLPTYSENCICGQSIKENCYIYNGKDIKILGSCCIERFLPNGISRKCSNCSEIHNNRKDNLCNECRVDFLTCKICGTPVEKDFKLQKYITCDTCINKDKIYLNVPFNQNQYAKSLGAKYDPVKKKWYAPHSEEILVKNWGDPLLDSNLSILKLGAIEKTTDNYILPGCIKINKFDCLKCEKEVILYKTIKNYIFIHKEKSTSCNFYENPSFSDKVIDAKYKLAHIYSNNVPMSIISDCQDCENIGLDFDIEYNSVDEINVNYELNNKKYVDLAITNSGKLKYIFSFKKPEEDLPEPWFLLDINNFYKNLDSYNEYNEEILILNCSRLSNNRKCKECSLKVLNEKWLDNLPRLPFKYGSERKWEQDLPCLKCKNKKYSPIFYKSYKSICKICFNEYYDSIKEQFSKDIKSNCLID